MLFLLQNSRLDNEIKERHRSKAKPGQGAFNRAIIDFLTAPVIEEIDCTNYHAQPGSYIIISTSDDFMLASVHLKIENNNGVILEESAAILLDGQLKWIYRPVVPVQEITGNTITVTVIDLPGNAVTGQKTMN